MTTALIFAQLPFNVSRRATGAFLDAESIKSAGGSCVVNWRHWEADDIVFTHRASWIKAGDGIGFLHTLDLARPAERRVYELARAGNLEISYGIDPTPEQTRASVAAMNQRDRPREVRPVATHDIKHMSYCERGDAAYPQPPVQVLIGE
jgi:hypothetical protein